MPSHPLRRHTILVGLAGVIAFGAAGGVATAATPGTVLLKQESPRSKTVTTTTVFNGRTVTAGLGVFHLQLTPQGQPTISAEGFCDDPLVGINGGVTYPISIQDLTDDPALDGANYRAAAYLIRTVDARLAAAADQSLESGATQIAVWQLGGRILATNPTNDPVMNARAAALRALALSATAVAPGATAGASACAGTGTVDVTISGAAGTLGTVTVSSGSAVASNSQVVLDATGHATVHITASAAGQSVVRVQLATGKLVRAARTGTNGPQQTVMVIPATTEFNVPVTFTDCTPAPNPGPGSTPSATPPRRPGVTPQSTPVTPGTQTPQGGTGTPGGSGTVPAVVQKPGLKVVKTGLLSTHGRGDTASGSPTPATPPTALPGGVRPGPGGPVRAPQLRHGRAPAERRGHLHAGRPQARPEPTVRGGAPRNGQPGGQGLQRGRRARHRRHRRRRAHLGAVHGVHHAEGHPGAHPRAGRHRLSTPHRGTHVTGAAGWPPPFAFRRDEPAAA
ncbi:MAG: hypothetical protein U0Y82_15615 [Thermoleophilia bacterium]